MHHLLVYKKTNGEIQRVISRTTDVDIPIASMGYNPMLYDSVRVSSQLTRIIPTEWRVENGIPVKILASTLASTVAVAPQGDVNLKLVFIGDKPTDRTGFGVQYDLLAKGLRQRNYIITFISFQEVEKIVDLDYDYVIALSDYTSIKKMFELNLNNWILWFALESATWPKDWNANLAKVSHIVPITKFGSTALEQNGLTCDDIISHGVSSEALRPVALRQRAVLRRENRVDSNFVVSYIGTNVERKHLDLLIDAYAKFVAKFDSNTDSRLLLKTKKRGAYEVATLISEAETKYGLVGFAKQIRVIDKEMDSEQVNEFINISDLGFSATAGEGFCVPIIEYLMCGVPFLMGAHTSAFELLGDVAPLIKVKEEYQDSRFKWNRYLIDTDHAAELIGQFFVNWKNNTLPPRQKLREYATRYSSQRMIDAWDLYLQDIEQKRIDDRFIEKSSSLLDEVGDEAIQNRSVEKAEDAVDRVPATDEPAKWIRIT